MLRRRPPSLSRATAAARRLSTATAVQLHHKLYPGPDQPAEPPLVLLHGLFGFGSNFQSVARKLAGGREVVLADLRNHGSSPWADDVSLVAMAEDVAALIGSLEAPEVALCGHSLGGKVAMLVALQRPELVSRLCVVDIAPVEYEMGANLRVIEALLEVPDEALASRKEADAALAAAAPRAEALGSQFVRQFLLQNLVPEQRSWRLNLRALLAGYPALRGFPAAEGATAPALPTLFVGGKKPGAMLGAEHLEACRAFFPAARLEMVDTGHFVHAEAPGPFVEIVDGWCRGVEDVIL